MATSSIWLVPACLPADAPALPPADLRGYTVLDQALSADELRAINAWVDEREATIRHVMRTDPIDYMPQEPSTSLEYSFTRTHLICRLAQCQCCACVICVECGPALTDFL